MAKTKIIKCASCQKTLEKYLSCPRCKSQFYCDANCRKNDVPNHKATCKRQNMVLKIDLEPRAITKPRITRTLSCPASATFADLHAAIQTSFRWDDMHAHQFWILRKKVPGEPRRYPMEEPLRLCDKSSLFFPDEDPGLKSTSDYRLHQIFDKERAGPRDVMYEYDFGDSWRHRITCPRRAEPTEHFVCIRGQGHPCAEDVGGFPGWLDLLEAYDAEERTEEQVERIQWYEGINGDEDAVGLAGDAKWKWDKDKVNEDLRGIMEPTEEQS